MEWPRLDELDDAAVSAAYEYVCQLVRERHPDADAKRGMLGTLVSELHAILHGAVRTVIQDVHSSLSVADVLEKPAHAKSELVDRLVANVGMSRQHVHVATGRLRIIVHRPVTISIMHGELFRSADGTYYKSEITALVRAPDVPLRQDELHMYKRGDKYSFTIPIRACESGTTPPRAGDPFEPAVSPPGFASAYADADFCGSYCLQDDVDVLRVMRLGMAAPSFSNRDGIEAMVYRADPTKYRFAADIADLLITGRPGKIIIAVRCRAGVACDALVKELQEYLDDPCRACLTAEVCVKAAGNA